jgi:phosphoglycolate phosphatase-like HAD superfamily hydrolase
MADPAPWLPIVVIGAGLVSAGFIRFLWPYRDRPGGWFFIGTIACEALWTLAYGAALFVFDPALRPWFELPIWVGANFIGVCFLAFALEYTGRSNLVRSPWMGALAGLQVVHPAIVATNPLHHVAWSGYQITPVLGAATVTYTHTLWLSVNFTGIFLMVAGGAFLLVLRWRAERFTQLGQSRSRTALLILLGIAAWTIAGAIYLGSGHPGFFGDRLFVVMRDQADVSAAHSLSDAAERRRYVYETLVAHADDTQGRLRRTLDRLGVSYTPYYLLNGLAVDGGPLVRAWLQAQPEVDRVLYNPRLRPAVPEGAGMGLSSAPVGTPWNLEMIRADEVWVIGDTPEDIGCGRASGLRTLAVATGRHGVEELRAHGADAVVAELSPTEEIVELLGG